jgi:chaperone modulatory protein CbpM
MFGNQTVTGVLIDEVALDLDELARACQVEPDWVVRPCAGGRARRRGAAGDEPALSQRRPGAGARLLELERHFDADEDLAALVIDLADEVRRLRARLRALGLDLKRAPCTLASS